MKMACTFFFTLGVILNSIELSLQSNGDSDTRRNSSYSSSDRQQSPNRNRPEEPPLHDRSMSPQGRPPTSEVLGYTLGQLGYIRLIPHANQSLQFEFRRYVFSAGDPIRLRAERNNFVPAPTREHIVLATSSGEVFAILDYSGVLRGIYRADKYRSRVKINMINGTIDNMTPDEARYCPIGEHHPIFPYTFFKLVTNYNSLQSELNPDSERNPGFPSSARQHSPDPSSSEERPFRARSRSPPGNPPSHKVLGYALGQLGYVRLISETNPNRRYEFRRYIFSVDIRIQLKVGHGKYVPVLNREYIVLSTAIGDVFSILEHSGIFRGIYRADRNHSRVKINMINGAVENMTADEAWECQVGRKYHRFIETVANNDSLQTLYH